MFETQYLQWLQVFGRNYKNDFLINIGFEAIWGLFEYILYNFRVLKEKPLNAMTHQHEYPPHQIRYGGYI